MRMRMRRTRRGRRSPVHASGLSDKQRPQERRTTPGLTRTPTLKRALKVGAGGQARMPAGPRVEETVGVQGHRWGAPYGVEEAIWARGGGRSEDYAIEVDRGQEEAAHAAATATKTHCTAHAGGGTRSPQVLPELFGAPTGEKNQGRGQGRSAANVYWAPQALTELFGPTGGGITTKTHRTAHAGEGGGRRRCGSPADFLLGPQALTESVATMAARRPVEANVSAARRADAATAATANNEAASPTAKRAYVASATRRSYGGCANETGEGVGYEDSAPRGDGEATAFTAMPAHLTMAARRTGDVEAAAVASKTTPRRMAALPRDDDSDDDAHQGARRRPPRATKAARRTGVDEAVFTLTMDDAEDDDVAPPRRGL